MDLESVNDSEAGVVLFHLEIVMAEICRIRITDAVKTERTEINVLVLCSDAPVIGHRVLQTAANHPANLGIVLMATFTEVNVALDDFLIEMDVAHRKSTGHIRQPFAESVTNTRTGRYQIIRSERRVQV